MSWWSEWSVKSTKWTFYIVLFIASFLMYQQFVSWQNTKDKIITEQQRLSSNLVPIQVIHDQYIENPKIKRGGFLIVHYDMSRNEACRVIISRFIIEEKTNTILWTTQAPASQEGVGEHIKGAVYVGPLPIYIGPGDYTYRSIRYNSECEPSMRSFTLPTIGIPFSILK